jgi:hypothetical protein
MFVNIQNKFVRLRRSTAAVCRGNNRHYRFWPTSTSQRVVKVPLADGGREKYVQKWGHFLPEVHLQVNKFGLFQHFVPFPAREGQVAKVPPPRQTLGESEGRYLPACWEALLQPPVANRIRRR